MIGRLAPYPEYKDCSAPWLGVIPKHWYTIRLKRLVSNVVDQTTIQGPSDIYVALEHVESWTGRIRRSTAKVEFESAVKQFQPNDLLFGKLRPYLAKVARPSRHGVCVGEFLVLRRESRAVSAEFLEQLLRSAPFIHLVNGSTFGAKMPRAEWSFMGGVEVAYPPNQEQACIVRFLNHIDRHTSRLIRTKRRLIELLNEQKQVIIHRAVTRGIDPNIRLRPSGINWLSNMPAHWDASRVKGEFDCLNTRRVPLSGVERGQMTSRQYPYYGASGVIDKVDGYLFDDELLLLAEDGANLVLRNLPLAIIAHGKFWVNNHAHVLKPRRGNLEYFSNVLECIDYQPWITGAAQPKLTKDRLMTIAIPVPPVDEQNRIVKWIDVETTSLRSAIERARREIDLVREYRTRLIADVVTGKVDVRGVELPELDAAEALEEVDTGEDVEEDDLSETGAAADADD